MRIGTKSAEKHPLLALVGDNPVRPFGHDMEGPIRFGNAPTFDPVLFCTAHEFIETLLAGDAVQRRADRRYDLTKAVR